MAQMLTALIAHRDADGAFLTPERVYDDLPAEENGLTEAENREIVWLAERLLPMYLEYCNQKHEQPAKVDEIERRKSCIT